MPEGGGGVQLLQANNLEGPVHPQDRHRPQGSRS